jgi:glycosyltransferase involved in cell wall biosynthesis
MERHGRACDGCLSSRDRAQTMRIGIDARQLCGARTGVGQYLSGLISEWARPSLASGVAAPSHEPRATSHEFVLYVPKPVESATVGLDARKFATRLVPGSGGTWWEQAQLPRKTKADHLDVFFAPHYTVPLSLKVPTVVAIHDVSFAAHPEWFRTREGARLRWLARRSAASARAIVTISEFSRREIVEHLKVPVERVRVIPPGIPERRATVDRAREARLLFVGSVFNRRHVVDLIRAFADVARAHPEASLDIAGDNRSYPHEDLAAAIAREQVGDRIRWHQYVSDDQLADLYQRARAFAFLSEYEGLGLTPLEALKAGAPPVLLDTPVARETCGDAALYVQQGNLAPITRAIERLLFDGVLRARLLASAAAILGKYSWARAGRETLALIEQSA